MSWFQRFKNVVIALCMILGAVILLLDLLHHYGQVHGRRETVPVHRRCIF